MSRAPPPVLNYATPREPDDDFHLGAMMRWRSRGASYFCGLFLLTIWSTLCWSNISYAGMVAGVSIWLLCAAGVLVCSTFTIIHMGKAATEAGVGYAIRQVVLAILLSPLFLLGVLIIPMVVQSDLKKWRRVDMRQVARDPTLFPPN